MGLGDHWGEQDALLDEAELKGLQSDERMRLKRIRPYRTRSAPYYG
jgi:hypothetical protein